MAHQDEAELLGSIVAFEGRQDTISTQLRLLPTSSQVLILPNVQCSLPEVDMEQAFDARVYVKRVHDALVARNETARAFLQASTPSNKRLVFLNGGTPSAHGLCIKAIMMHETAGDKEEATALLDDLIKDGVAGLREDWHRRTSAYDRGHGDFEDPITRAMRAADALDRQTANLQPSDDLDLTASTRQRSSSLPLYGYSDAFGDAAPFFVFGARTVEKDGPPEEASSANQSKTASTVSPPEETSQSQKPTLLNPWNRLSIPNSPSCIGETYEPSSIQDRVEVEPASPTSDVFSIKTLENVVYGEASVLDVRSSISGRGSLARVKSLDRIFPMSPKFRDLCIPSKSWLAEPDTPRRHRPQSLMVLREDKDTPWHRLSIAERPRTVMVRSKTTIVKVAPVPQGKKKKRRHVRARSTYVDRGTDPHAESCQQAPLQPVFPLNEDLVVFLKEETVDGVLEAAIAAFRDGRYPLIPAHAKAMAESIEEDEKLVPGTPSSPSSEAPRHCKSVSERDEGRGILEPNAGDDYDPFAYIQAAALPQKPSSMGPKVTVVRPPTPAHTPPPSVAPQSEPKFHEFTIAANQTAVAVQNSLRSILAEYFPPDTQGYHQFQFSLLPEFDGLWKPIFRDTESVGPQKGEGNLHQILAIGSQKGVKKEYSLSITGQLERLGSKSSDLGRADIVDFRYLLANAMQAFTAQPLANQTSDNPFTNSYLLATLIVPHLETYLALHSEVQYLLLQYPPEHLGTVLALQKLVGVDLMKVAQIVDSNSKEHLPFTHIRGASIGNKSEASSAKRSTPSPSSPTVPVSKANFLLTSTASDKDIAKFVSTVWNIQADCSDLDASEPQFNSTFNRKAKPSPLQLGRETSGSMPKLSPRSPPVSPKTVVASPPVPDVPPSTVRPTSATESTQTAKSVKSKQSRCKSRGTTAASPGDAASIMSYDPADDSDYDVEERRLMPLFLRKKAMRKPNSRKALKFLGLA